MQKKIKNSGMIQKQVFRVTVKQRKKSKLH